jgi:hypothetical protein
MSPTTSSSKTGQKKTVKKKTITARPSRKSLSSKKKEKRPAKLTRVSIVDYTEEFQIEKPKDDYARGTTRTTHDIRGFTIVKDDEYGELEVAYSIDSKQQYYLLAVIYDAGDSFGLDQGCIDFIGLYRTFNEAQANALRIREHYDKNSSELFLISPSGKEYKAGAPWKGWSSELDQILVVPVLQVEDIKRYYSRY